MATNKQKYEAAERMGNKTIARHYKMLMDRENRASGSPKSRKGGLGSNKGAAKYKNTSAEDRKKANTDGKFGYFDEVNKRYVPAFIDAMDGGGRDNRGDTFEGGPLSGILNDLGVKPYGSQMERAYGGPTTSPIQQAVTSPRPRMRPEPSDMPDMRMPANAAYMSPLEPFGGPGPNITGAAAERGMGLDPFGGAGMNMDYLDPRSQGYDSGFRVPPVSTYGGDIDPTQDGRIQAQQNIDNRERMRRAMSQITKAEYDAMSRGQRADMGLPVRGIDLMFAGSDAFKQPMVGGGRGQASGDYGFDRFMNMVRNDANYSYLMNDPEMAYSVYNRMQQSGTQF